MTSGGTVADLEVNAVRFLDNFSTGLRGACAVEQFLKRGYAVIHLKRSGSVSPFVRLVEDAVGGGGRIGFESIGKLFDCGLDADGQIVDLDGDFDLKPADVVSDKTQKRASSEDPWLYSTDHNEVNSDGYYGTKYSASSKSKRSYGELSLNSQLTHSHVLQSTVRSYNNIVQQGLLITIAFRTVDDYLQKLQLCCEALDTAGSLGLVYLAAAVSDFYIPLEKRAVHKIQSRDYGLKNSEESNATRIGADDTLTITLYPVPKVIPTLRKAWCPNAFVISFKLETDSSILRQKATMAMKRNGVHLVIGNELKTRYEKVFILSNSNATNIINGAPNETSLAHDSEMSGDKYSMIEIKSTSTNATENSGKVDALEDATIENVVRHHFYYISTKLNDAEPNMSSIDLFARTTSKAEKQHQSRLQVLYRKLQQEKLRLRVYECALNIAGSVVGMALSYGVAKMLQQRKEIS